MSEVSAVRKSFLGTLLAVTGALCVSQAASAAPRGAASGAPSTPQAAAEQPTAAFSMRYAIFVHGFHVLDGNIAYSFEPWGYGATAHIYSIGLASWFLTLNRTARAEGRFAGGEIQPATYESQGFSRGKNRNVKLAFDKKTGPKVLVLSPPDEGREKLPEADLQNSMDLLSAFGQLLHKLDTQHTCDVTSTVFDGLRLTRITAHGPVPAQLPTDHHPYFNGPAERCSFVGQQIAGFPLDTDHRARLAAPHPGDAWFRDLPGIGMVPVRIEVDYPKLGKVLMVMQGPPGTVNTKLTTPAR